jgi:hypothetical protein
VGQVKAGAIAYLLGDPAGGSIEDRGRAHGSARLPPGVDLLPHVSDVSRAGCLPPCGLGHGLYATGAELALGLDPGPIAR